MPSRFISLMTSLPKAVRPTLFGPFSGRSAKLLVALFAKAKSVLPRPSASIQLTAPFHLPWRVAVVRERHVAHANVVEHSQNRERRVDGVTAFHAE